MIEIKYKILDSSACVIAKGLELDDALAMLYGLCHKYEGETKECGWIIKSYEEVDDEQ